MKVNNGVRRIAASTLLLGIIAGLLLCYNVGRLNIADDLHRETSTLSTGLIQSFMGEEKSRILHKGIDAVPRIPVDAIASNDSKLQANRHSFPSLVDNSTVVSWKGVNGMNSIISQSWQQSLFCKKIDEIRSSSMDPDVHIIANFTVSCLDLYQKSIAGTGNFISLIYGIRLAAYAYGNVDVYFTCTDAERTKKYLILPWITGRFPARPKDQPLSNLVSFLPLACGKFAHIPLAYILHAMQYELRKMAIELVGVPSSNHPSARFEKEFLMSNDKRKRINPLYSPNEYELDDAVLHFRCGDLMDSTHGGFSFMKFNGYTRHISPETKSIGILTQPFDDTVNTQTRTVDMAQHKRDRCRIVVNSLVNYIEERHPTARVRIRNGAGETIALTFARMIMANQTIAGISSFSAIASVVTFGTGFIRYPEYSKGPNQWLIRPRIDKIVDNVVLFDEPDKIMVSTIKQLWETQGKRGVLEWFMNDTVV
jgi:hypothetical protein